MEKDSYLLELARYVVLNPFRAGMIKEVGEWSWSSYPAMIGAALAAGLPSLWDDLRQQIFLDSEAFVTRMQAEVSQE